MKKIKVIIIILVCLLLLPMNVFAITYGKVGEDTNFNGDVNVPSGMGYYVNGVRITSDALSDVDSIAMLDEAETVTGQWTLILPIIKGTSASDLPTYSAEFLDADNWTSVDWTGSWAAGWDHDTGNTTALSHDHNAVNTTKYQIAYTVTGRTAGTFVITFGGQTSASISATGAWGPTATSTVVLAITPTTDFDGTIIISIKSITAVSTALSNYQLSNGTAIIQMRANTASGDGDEYNTFLGYLAGQYNTTGYGNTAFGRNTLKYNTTGLNNTAIGRGAMRENTTGWNNTSVGIDALCWNITGYQLSALGVDALYSNTTGYSNSAFGDSALKFNTTGIDNTAMGNAALYSNTTGYANNAIGKKSLYENSTGWCNSAVGNEALYSNEDGTFNLAFGHTTLYSNTSGSNNSAVGRNALYSNTTGGSNIAVGMNAGRYQANGSTALVTPENSVYLGTGTRGYDNDDSNSIVIGYNAIGKGANNTVIGNANTTNTHLYGVLDLDDELDAGAHSIGFTLQTATGDGTTTIDWKLGNKFRFTFGAQNDALTFTAPTNSSNHMLWVIQDATGSRTITWPTIKWANGTAPVLSTAANAIDIVGLAWDGTSWFGVANFAFAVP